jgi:hypothetical protein
MVSSNAIKHNGGEVQFIHPSIHPSIHVNPIQLLDSFVHAFRIVDSCRDFSEEIEHFRIEQGE